MATVTLYGRLGKDPEIRFFESGNAVAKFSVGDSTGRRDEPTSWFDCEVWGKGAQVVADYVKKGHRLYVTGRVKTEEFTTKTGDLRKKQVINVSDFTMVETKAEAQGSAPAPAEDEIPF